MRIMSSRTILVGDTGKMTLSRYVNKIPSIKEFSINEAQTRSIFELACSICKKVSSARIWLREEDSSKFTKLIESIILEPLGHNKNVKSLGRLSASSIVYMDHFDNYLGESGIFLDIVKDIYVINKCLK